MMPQTISIPVHQPARNDESSRHAGRVAVTILALWTGAWLLADATGLAVRIPLQASPAMILTLPAAFAAFYRRRPAFRAWIAGLDLRALVLFHAVRAPIGAAFLWLFAHGRLPGAFALGAGWGDVASGALALAAAACLPAQTALRRRAVLTWNAFALADIALVLVSAQRLIFTGRGAALVELTHFPLSLLRPVIVPLVLITHFVVWARLGAPAARAGATSAY